MSDIEKVLKQRHYTELQQLRRTPMPRGAKQRAAAALWHTHQRELAHSRAPQQEDHDMSEVPSKYRTRTPEGIAHDRVMIADLRSRLADTRLDYPTRKHIEDSIKILEATTPAEEK